MGHTAPPPPLSPKTGLFLQAIFSFRGFAVVSTLLIKSHTPGAPLLDLFSVSFFGFLSLHFFHPPVFPRPPLLFRTVLSSGKPHRGVI